MFYFANLVSALASVQQETWLQLAHNSQSHVGEMEILYLLRRTNSHLPYVNLLKLHLPSFLLSASLLIILSPSLFCGFIDLVQEPRLLQIDHPDLFIASPHPHLRPSETRGVISWCGGRAAPCRHSLTEHLVPSLFLLLSNGRESKQFVNSHLFALFLNQGSPNFCRLQTHKP